MQTVNDQPRIDPDETTFYDLRNQRGDFNYRWVQPPQVAYFVTTADARGNVNSTPVTLGTCVSVDMQPEASGSFYLTFSLGRSDLDVPDIETRHGFSNLQESDECVISWIGAHLFVESQVAGLPLPRGISEIDVAGMTELESRIVSPPGIKEALVNLECVVEQNVPIGDFYQMYVVRVVGASIASDLVDVDRSSRLRAGLLALDPLLEASIFAEKGRPQRLYYMKLDPKKLMRMTDRFGPVRNWIGKFEDWLEDEVERGRLDSDARDRLVTLNARWQENPDPEVNVDVRNELTEGLKLLCEVKPTQPLKRDMVGWNRSRD